MEKQTEEGKRMDEGTPSGEQLLSKYGKGTFSIGEVSTMLGVHTHTIRFWEKSFRIVIPRKESNRRRYTLADITLLKKIQRLVHNEKLSLNTARCRLEAEGVLLPEPEDEEPAIQPGNEQPKPPAIQALQQPDKPGFGFGVWHSGEGGGADATRQSVCVGAQGPVQPAPQFSTLLAAGLPRPGVDLARCSNRHPAPGCAAAHTGTPLEPAPHDRRCHRPHRPARSSPFRRRLGHGRGRHELCVLCGPR